MRRPNRGLPPRAPRVGVFRGPALAPPTRKLTRPAPVKRNERALPPAPMPSYPLLRHYTKPQQAAIVRGIQRSGNRVADRGAIRPQALLPLSGVRYQQDEAAVHQFARQNGISPDQARALRDAARYRSQARPGRGISARDIYNRQRSNGFLERLGHGLLTGDTGQPNTQRMATQNFVAGALQPATGTFNPLGATYEKAPKIPYSGPLGTGTLAGSLDYLSKRNKRIAADAGQSISASLRRASQRTRSGSGGTAIAPGFIRSPLSTFLLGASEAAPTLSRVGAGAANDVGQYVLGAIPAAAMIGEQAIHNPGAALKSVAQGFTDPLKHPLDHPLFALAMLHGAVRGVSRTAGAVGRSPISPESVRKALTTERSPLQIAGPGNKRLLLYRHYSKDPLVKAVQVLMDRKLPKGAKVHDQHGKLVDAKLAAENKLASVLGQDAAHQLRKFGDHTADRANAVERANRAEMTQELVKMMPTREHRGNFTIAGKRFEPGQAVGGYIDRMLHSQPQSGVLRLPGRYYRPERDVVSLVISGVIRSAKTFKVDLEHELRALHERAQHSFDHPAEREANLSRQRTISRVLNDPKAMANAERTVAAGRALAIRGRQLTERAVRDQALTREQADRAPLFDYAIRHMGARHFTVEQHAALEREHLGREAAAKAIVHDAERTVRQAERAIKENKPHLISAPHGDNFLNRTRANDHIDRLSEQHGEVLRRYNAANREVDKAAEMLHRIPAGAQKEHFRKTVYGPLVDAAGKIFAESNKLSNEIGALRERVQQADRGELITGQPDRPINEVTWYHGTPEAYDTLPSAHGAQNDLGVYMTSDPHYASGYGEHSITNTGETPAVQLVHVNPRKVLETRLGRVDPDQMVAVIQAVLTRADKIQAELEKAVHEQVDRIEARNKAEGKPPPAAGFRESHVRQSSSHVLYSHNRDTLERWLKLLRDDKKTRDIASGKRPIPRDDGTLAGWQEFDKVLMRIAPSDLSGAEANIRIARGEKGGAGWGTRHQPVRQVLREMGYDAVRKIDQHADSLVVLNESIMRKPGEARPRPGKSTAHIAIGDHLEAQRLEADAQLQNVHVTRTFRKGDGIVAEVQGAPDAIDRLAAKHAHDTNTNVMALHHDPKAEGGAFTVLEKDGTTSIYLEAHPTDAYLEQLRAAHPDAKITATPGSSRMLTPEHHAAFARDIQTAGHRGGDHLARNLESARARLAAAQRAHSYARDRRIAVSGRHPELTKRHEAARAAVARAHARAKTAGGEHVAAVSARDRLIGAQSSRRGRRQAEAVGGRGLTRTAGERPSGKATAAEQRKLQAAETRIATAKAKRKAAEAAHRDIKAKAEKVPRPEIKAGLRRDDGTYLPNEDIHKDMRASGIPFDNHGPVVAYLPHTPDFNSRAAYHRAQALLKRDTVESGFQRTGRSLEKGTVGTSYELVAQHHIRMGITTGDGAIGQFDKLVREAATVGKDGRPFTNAEADQYLENLGAHPNQPPLVKVRLFAGRYTPGQKAAIQQMQSPGTFDPAAYGHLHEYVERSFAERVANPGEAPAWSKSGERNIALMPEQLVKRYRQHLTALGNRSPTGALLAQAFRTAVLPFSVKWLVGNVAEAVIRLAVIGGNPLDYAAGRKVMTHMKGRDARTIAGRQVLKEIIGLDMEHAGLSNEIQSSLLGGLFYGEKGLTVHRDSSYYEDSRLKVPAQIAGGLAHTTMLREFGHEVARIPRSIFAVNRFMERQTQYVALGRYVRRDIQEFTHSWLQTVRLQEQAIREAARGLYNTPAQADAARFMDETLGKYSRFNPRLRAVIQTIAPFLPWYLNAVRFVFWTMPLKHPTVTAALLAAETTFGKDIAQQHKDLPPGELKAAVKAGGGWRDLARFTPFGAFTGVAGGDYRTAISPFLPQVQGLVHAVSGEDPFGRQLQVPKTPDNPKGVASLADQRRTLIDQFLGSFVPGYAPIERVAQHGETPYSGRNSLLFGISTKPDSSHGYSGLRRLLDPFRPVYLKKPAAVQGQGTGFGPKKSTGAASGWGSGASSGSTGWGG